MSSFSLNSGQKWLMKGIDMVLPPRCVISGAVVSDPGTLSPEAWASLRFIAAPACRTCSMPFEFSVDGVMQCGACLADPPPFTTARAVLAYDDASRDLILKFKHGDYLQAVPSLVAMMQRAGAEVLDEIDVIMPVPLHRWRLLKRRYNQAGLLATGLAQRSGKACIPDGLYRIRATPPQGHKRARDRAMNVKKAFAINPRHADRLAGASVLLVDDVYTTGATLRECARVLIDHGAKGVHVLTLARVLRDQQV